jgi:hypothetical protein
MPLCCHYCGRSGRAIVSSSSWSQSSHCRVIIAIVIVVALLCCRGHSCSGHTTISLLLCYRCHSHSGCTIILSSSWLQSSCHCVIIAVVTVVAPLCHHHHSRSGCATVSLLSWSQLLCGHVVVVAVTVVAPLCCRHCHGCIVFAVILAIVVRPRLEKAKCFWCKSSAFGNGYQVRLFGVWTMQLMSKSKSRHFHGMFSFFPPCQAMHSWPLPQLVPPLPHKWYTYAHTVCCLMVIALGLPCQPPSRGPYHGPEVTLPSSTQHL